MNEVLLRRLIGALVLLAGAFLLSLLVPSAEPPAPATDPGVVFELDAPRPPPVAAAFVEPLRPPALKLAPALAAAAPPKGAAWYVQIGSFGKWENAQAALTRMQALGHNGAVERVPAGASSLHRVRIGPYTDGERARAALSMAVTEGFRGAKLVESAR